MATPFKEHVSAVSIDALAAALAPVRGFDPAPLHAAADGLAPLELKARIAHVAAALARALPAPFARTAPAVAAAVAASDLDTWGAWPVQTWVEERGLEDPEMALEAIGAMTARASGEMAVRPYLDLHPDAAWAAVRGWAASPDADRRRLASEGTRPRLPWARAVGRLIEDPQPGLAVIDGLRADPAEYVRRSVANHLNDVTRDNPEAALALAARWRAQGGPHADAVLRRGLRWLVKHGDPRALALLGVDADAAVEVDGPHVAAPEVPLGEHLRFTATLRAPAGGRVAVDYALGREGARPKVFKLAVRDLAPGEPWHLERRHRVRPVTTRRVEPGPYVVALQVNGAARGEAAFRVV